jgi:hypothetical protein
MASVFFHGTAAVFSAFNRSSRGSCTGYDGADLATFVAASPSAAGFYAELSAQVLAEQNERADDESEVVEIDARVLLVELDLDSLELLVLDGEADEDSDLYGLIENDRAALAYARSNGFAGVRWPHGSVSNEGDTIALLNPSDAAIVGVWSPAARMAA